LTIIFGEIFWSIGLISTIDIFLLAKLSSHQLKQLKNFTWDGMGWRKE
jgi:hypothetical protein